MSACRYAKNSNTNQQLNTCYVLTDVWHTWNRLLSSLYVHVCMHICTYINTKRTSTAGRHRHWQRHGQGQERHIHRHTTLRHTRLAVMDVHVQRLVEILYEAWCMCTLYVNMVVIFRVTRHRRKPEWIMPHIYTSKYWVRCQRGAVTKPLPYTLSK